MKKQFVPYEIALALKELGFDDECLMWFTHKENLSNDAIFLQYKNKKEFCFAPLWQQVIDFFIEKYGLHIVITVNPYSEIKEVSGYKIYSENKDLKCIVNQETQSWSKYKARKQAILKTIELCQKEK